MGAEKLDSVSWQLKTHPYYRTPQKLIRIRTTVDGKWSRQSSEIRLELNINAGDEVQIQCQQVKKRNVLKVGKCTKNPLIFSL